ncbi:MAG: lysophospholipid acyltransferase family protein [Gemmatimonadota bacterium]|nr:lysophospholipid acyltransferase family protein [Gemmatimonadota bacterium]
MTGLEHVPREGALLVACNHIGTVDPPLIGSALPREVFFAAKRELFGVPLLGRTIRALNSIPVDRDSLSVKTLREFDRVLESQGALLYFPEGTRGRQGRPRRPKIGVGMVLTRNPVPVLPVRVEGSDHPLRSLLRRGRVRVAIGRPFTLPKGDTNPENRREDYRRIASVVMEHITELEPGRGISDRGNGSPEAKARR